MFAWSRYNEGKEKYLYGISCKLFYEISISTTYFSFKYNIPDKIQYYCTYQHKSAQILCIFWIMVGVKKNPQLIFTFYFSAKAKFGYACKKMPTSGVLQTWNVYTTQYTLRRKFFEFKCCGVCFNSRVNWSFTKHIPNNIICVVVVGF